MTLPASYRWADDSEGGARLYWNYVCVASLKPNGTTRLNHWKKQFDATAASVAESERFIERWISAQSSPRADEWAQWRRRYSKAVSGPLSSRQVAKRITVAILAAQPPSGPPSSRIIMYPAVPEGFDTIADVGQALQALAVLSRLNVTTVSSDAGTAQRGTTSVAQRRHAPSEQRRQARP